MSVSRDRTPAEAMTTRQPVRVQLEIRSAAGTILGRLAVDGDQRIDLHGWLELINALERTANPSGA
jgi:hypothetical protein